MTAGDRDRTEAVLQAHLSNASAASSSSHKAWLGTVLKWSLRDVLEQEAQRAEEDLRGPTWGEAQPMGESWTFSVQGTHVLLHGQDPEALPT